MSPDEKISLSTELNDNMQRHLLMINRFDAYLNNIKKAITVSNAEQLSSLVNEPPEDFEQIELCRQQRQNMLAKHGYNDDDGLQSFILHEGNDALRKSYDSLSDAISKLERSLLVNDLLIRKNQHRVRQSLNILSGHGTSTNSVTYSRKGSTDKQYSDKHSIALA